MGVSLDCVCVHCDFVQYGIRLGSDMIMGYNYFPAYQALEKRVTQINIFKSSKSKKSACRERTIKN